MPVEICVYQNGGVLPSSSSLVDEGQEGTFPIQIGQEIEKLFIVTCHEGKRDGTITKKEIVGTQPDGTPLIIESSFSISPNRIIIEPLHKQAVMVFTGLPKIPFYLKPGNGEFGGF